MLKIKKNLHLENIDKILLSGDKSISILTLFVSSFCSGISKLENISNSHEIEILINILNEFGIKINKNENILDINGDIIKNWKQPKNVININSSVEIFSYLLNIISKTKFKTFITSDYDLIDKNFKELEYLKSGNNIEFRKDQMLPLLNNGTSKFKQKKVNVYNTVSKYSMMLNSVANNFECNIHEDELKEEYLESILRYYGFKIKEFLSEKRNIINGNSKSNKEIQILKSNEVINGKNFFIPVSIEESVYTIFISYLLGIKKVAIENVLLNELNSDIIKILIDNGLKIEYKNQRISNGLKVVDFHINYENLNEISISRKRLDNIINMYPLLIMLNVIKKNKITLTGFNNLKNEDNYVKLIEILKKLNVKINENKDILEIDPSSLNTVRKKFNIEEMNLNEKFKLVLFLSNLGFSKNIFEIDNIDKNILKIFPNIYNIFKQLNLVIENEN